jgi:hypothetical protein
VLKAHSFKIEVLQVEHAPLRQSRTMCWRISSNRLEKLAEAVLSPPVKDVAQQVVQMRAPRVRGCEVCPVSPAGEPKIEMRPPSRPIRGVEVGELKSKSFDACGIFLVRLKDIVNAKGNIRKPSTQKELSGDMA